MKKTAVLSLAVIIGLACGAPGFAIKPLSGGISQDAYGLSDDIAHAEAMAQANAEDPEAWFLMAVAYSRTPYVERALEALEKSKKLARKSPEGFALFDRKIAEYEKMQAKTPDDPTLLYRMGFGYYIRGYAVDHKYIKSSAQPSSFYYEKAQATFERLVAIDSGDFMALNYLGYLLAERDPVANMDMAVALWEKSLRISEENPGAYMLLGQAAIKKGNLRQAVEYSTKALKARNAWLEAHNLDPAKVRVRL